MFKMTREKFLPLFRHCMNASYDSPLLSVYNSPLDCQVIIRGSEIFLSDGFHIVLCEFTKDAMIIIKQYYPLTNLKDLDKNVITLLEYMPIMFSERRHSPVVRVYDFYFDPVAIVGLSLIHICRCRRYAVCRSRWSPYH
eukprot:TRINITY_DN14643_c0_g1_i3.p1 TRINITY_DN14643_c0_g1~~TRINITY_DN14643_c0_g1_i3.p1  ORF type:complete len:139 (+),score=11.44 TRINITY_DN14643_c0_g1_i3:58-474(+)